MLSDPETIDVITPIAEDALLLAIMDLYPWPDPDADERLDQFQRKLDAYCRYVIGQTFENEHPKIDRSKLVISVVTITPASKRMRKIQAVYTPSDPSYEILVRFADGDQVTQSEVDVAAKKPWWKFWG